MSNRAWSGIKWLKVVMLSAAVASVYIVDNQAGEDRKSNSIEENKRDLQMVWDVTAKLVAVNGESALPIQEQQAWESLDVYCVAADETARFMTPPRFEPMRTLVQESLLKDYEGRVIDCWTDPVKNARNGLKGVMVTRDYRDTPVISAYGIVKRNREELVLLVEMDVREAVAVNAPNYWDEVLVTIINLVVAIMVLVVHYHRDGIHERNKEEMARRAELERAAEEVIQINAALQDKNAALEQQLENLEVDRKHPTLPNEGPPREQRD